jgi:N-acetylmuramoyl-L-alanine amidase
VPGAISARGFYEYDFNMRLAKVVEHKLRDAGFAKTILLVTDGPARRACSIAWRAPTRRGPTSSSPSTTIPCRTRS